MAMALAMFGLICVDVILRATTGRSTLIAGEVSGYMLVALVMLSLAHAQSTERHVEINLLTKILRPRLRHGLKLAMLSGSIAYMAWFISVTWNPVAHNYINGVRSLSNLATPMWIPYIFVPIGAAMLLVELVAELLSQTATSPYNSSNGAIAPARPGTTPE